MQLQGNASARQTAAGQRSLILCNPCYVHEWNSYVYLVEGTINGDTFAKVPVTLFNAFQWHKPQINSDDGQCEHPSRGQNQDLIESKAKARLCFLPPYSLDLMPAEGVFSQMKSIKQNDSLFQACTAPRVLLMMAFGMIIPEDCYGHIK